MLRRNPAPFPTMDKSPILPKRPTRRARSVKKSSDFVIGHTPIVHYFGRMSRTLDRMIGSVPVMSIDLDTTFEDHFKELVGDEGPTDVADRIGHGATKQLVSNWMTGTLPRADMVFWIAETYRVNARWLVIGDAPKELPREVKDQAALEVAQFWDYVEEETRAKVVQEIRKTRERLIRFMKDEQQRMPLAPLPPPPKEDKTARPTKKRGQKPAK